MRATLPLRYVTSLGSISKTSYLSSRSNCKFQTLMNRHQIRMLMNVSLGRHNIHQARETYEP